MKLYKFKVKITSINFYEREIIAENEDKAIDDVITSLDDNDKVSEDQFECYDIEKLYEASEHDYD